MLGRTVSVLREESGAELDIVFETPSSPFCRGEYPVKDAQKFPRRGAMSLGEEGGGFVWMEGEGGGAGQGEEEARCC